MSVVLAHDFGTQEGGTERVALHIHDGLSAERLLTVCMTRGAAFSGFSRHEVQTSFLQGCLGSAENPG